SSRRRHTRLQGDWSSDVCSSDLSRSAGLALVKASRLALVLPPMCRATIFESESPGSALYSRGPLGFTGGWPRSASSGSRESRPRSEERRVGKEGGVGWVAGALIV